MVFGCLSALIIVSVGVSSYLVIQRDITRDIADELGQITASTYHLVDTSVNVSIKNYLRAIAEKTSEMVASYHRQYQQGALTEDEAYARAKAFILHPDYGKIGDTGYLAGVDGAGVLVIHPKSEGVDASKLEFMQQAIAMKNGYLEYMWKNVDEERERAKAGWLTYFEPWDLIVWASSYKSEFYSLINLDDFKEKILAIRLRDSGYAYIISNRGEVIMHPFLEAGVNFYDEQDQTGKYFVREMLANKNGEITYYWKSPDEETARKKLAHYRYLEEMDWLIICSVYMDELYQPVWTLIYRLLTVSFGILLFVAALSIFLGRSLARPLKELAGYARSVGEGHLGGRFPVQGGDEVGELGRAFNTMSDNLQTFIGQVQRSGIQVTSSSTELAATAKQQEAIVIHQVNSTRQVVESVTQISEVAEALVVTMQHVSVMAQETAGFASSGQTDLLRMEQAMQHMEEASKAISGRLETINEKAENITTVVTTINKVADQTNLLSLNAAIEAEKAGEYGRGFTVVAREIRRLADQTALATLEIEHMVKEMQSAVSSGVMEMDKFIASVRHSAEDVENISTQLTRIIEQVQALTPNFEDVNESMVNQSINAQGIKDAMTSLSDEAQQTKDSLHETYSVIEQLNEAARGLQDEISRFQIE